MSLDLPRRTDYHLPRRLFHMLAGVLVVSVCFYVGEKKLVLLVASITCLSFLAFEFLRIKWKPLRDIMADLFKPVMRQGEETQISGMPFFALGVLISFVIFPVPIAVMAILFLSFGDPIASIVGCYYRKRSRQWELVQGKSFQGTVACGLVCFLISAIYGTILFELDWLSFELLAFATAGALAAALAELLPVRTDDNLSIPVISGALLWLYASFAQLMPGLILP